MATYREDAINLLNGAKHWRTFIDAHTPSTKKRAETRWRLWAEAQPGDPDDIYKRLTVKAAMGLAGEALRCAYNTPR